MSSQKRDNHRGNGSSGSNGSKKARLSSHPDFVSDGLDNDGIRNIIKEIIKTIQNTKVQTPNVSHSVIVDSINENDKFKFFIERYPMLFDMVTKDIPFDFESLEYFLSMREDIIKKKITSDDASKKVGQVWFDKYYKPEDNK